MEPSVLFNREQGEVFHERAGEHADAPIGGHPLRQCRPSPVPFRCWVIPS